MFKHCYCPSQAGRTIRVPGRGRPLGDPYASDPGQPHMAAIFNGPSYSKMISQLIEQFSESWRRDYVTVYSPTTGLVAASAKSIRDKLKALSETH